MPVVTRSCTKQRGRPRIEDDTPMTSTTVPRRYPTRSSAKRKILRQENQEKGLEPPSKRAASCRSSKNVLKPKNLPFQEISNTVSYADKGDQATKSRKGPVSRIPRRCANNNKNEYKTTSSPSNNSDKNDAKDNDDQRSPSLEKSVNLNDVSDGKEIIPTTPAGCIAARIRSYSALRRSQWKKNGKDCSSDSNKENTCCSPAKTMSLLEETDCDPMSTEVENNSDLSSENESDEDILWKMSRRHCSEKEDVSHAKLDDKSSYKTKYFTLMSAMKQLQNTFLRAQKNTERNVKAYDRFVSNLKSSLSIEKQKNSLLGEEVKIKKGTVERLRSELENTKEQLEYMKEEKVNIEKQDRERSEKETDLDGKALGMNEKELLQLIEDQKSVIEFYSQLTGVTLSQENASEDVSPFQSFNCTFFPAANTSHCLQFRLTLDKEFDEIEYSPNPRSPGSEEVLLSLPNYLQENIFFNPDQAPKFLAKLLKTAD